MIEFISQNWKTALALVVVFGTIILSMFAALWTIWVRPAEARAEDAEARAERLTVERDNARRGLAIAAAEVLGFDPNERPTPQA